VTTQEEKKNRKPAIIGLIFIVTLILMVFFAVTLLLGTFMAPDANAQIEEQIQGEIKDFVSEQLDEGIDKLTSDIDFEDGNFLNTNEEETTALSDASKEWFKDLWQVLWSTKDVAHAGVEFASPFEINAIVISGISLVIAITFIVTIVKKMAWHIFIVILAVLAVGAIIVFFKLNS
jgi:hypothetical protein